MITYDRSTHLAAPIERVFDFFSVAENLARITPPGMGFRIVSSPPHRLQKGDRIEYAMRLLGVIPVRWSSLIAEWIEGERFADAQERGPFKSWLHTHSFRLVDGGVEMTDHVDYELPLGLLGRIVAGWWVRRLLDRVFEHREQALVANLATSARPAAPCRSAR